MIPGNSPGRPGLVLARLSGHDLTYGPTKTRAVNNRTLSRNAESIESAPGKLTQFVKLHGEVLDVLRMAGVLHQVFRLAIIGMMVVQLRSNQLCLLYTSDAADGS